MDIGVFIPIGNNGWLISKTSPQYMPTFELNKQITQKAERYGLDFALSMIKLRGFGGQSEFWDHNLESFTLMAGLAAVTTRIQLYASVAVLTIRRRSSRAWPRRSIRSPAAASASTSCRAGPRTSMSRWACGRARSISATATTTAPNTSGSCASCGRKGSSDFKGEHFQMTDCKLSPRPQADMKIVCAGQSPRGLEFGASYCDFNFTLGKGINTPTAHAPLNQAMADAAAKTGRDVGNYVLMMVIADETDEAAMAKWKHYNEGADMGALAWMSGQANSDPNAPEGGTAKAISAPEGAINFNMGTLVGSYASVARMLDECATVVATKGIMLTFDDFLIGLEQFGQRIQPLMKTRQEKLKAVA